MQTQQLGSASGLVVSRLCLGTMNFGIPGRGHQGDWTLDVDAARPIFELAKDLGINYFDCANIYGVGASEEVVGQLLRETFQRDEYVLTTKVSMPMGRAANQGGLSRKHIIESVNASLDRLGLDYVDQLIIHRHPHGIPGQVAVPIEETLEALNDTVKAGKALYLGASSMFAWQFAELQLLAKHHGWTQFISMQNHLNLIYREEEREMLPYCRQSGIGVTPWSPLARGILTGAYQGSLESGSTNRSKGADRLRTASLYRGKMDFEIADRCAEVAEQHAVSSAQVALAWLLHKPGVVAPVVGVSSTQQLTELAAAVELKLSEADIEYLEELYQSVDNLLSLGTS
jgi:1-deoxyxylulose-5-phosphate synthase